MSEYGEKGRRLIVTWLVRQLRFRAKETTIESDRNASGVQAILRWLREDMLTLEAKFQHQSGIFGDENSAQIKAIEGLIDGLGKLIARVELILHGGSEDIRTLSSGFSRLRFESRISVSFPGEDEMRARFQKSGEEISRFVGEMVGSWRPG